MIRGELWEKEPHKVPACVDCHQPHEIRRVFYSEGMANRDCMKCHGDPEPVGGAGRRTTTSLFVNEDQLARSRHARTACVQCHTGADPTHQRPCDTVSEKVDCSICHPDTVTQFQQSAHGKLLAEGSPDAPDCAHCHGTHGVLGHNQPDSPTFSRNVPALCADCHRTGSQADVRPTSRHLSVVENYMDSIHAKGLLESGLTVTANCADCHTAHLELPASDPRSSVNRKNISATCGRCHLGITELFETSVHSPKNTHTDKELPTCEDCHSAHDIQRTDLTDFRFEIMDQCGRCHEEISQSYFDTFHGKVSRLGYEKAAKCYDCHGSHDILPVSDPRSHLSRENIVETCAKCHPQSHRQFAGYLTHATHHDPKKYPYLFITFWGMTGLLLGTFAVSGLHTLLWLPRSLHYKTQVLGANSHQKGQPYVRRFRPYERNLHLMVIFSFLGLATTGMLLKFSYTGWAKVISGVIGGFEATGWIHRFCAVVTFSYFGLHIYDLFKKRRASGKSWKQFIFGPGSMMFNGRDLSEFIGSLKWFVGKGSRPQYGRWTYWEKFDYFAVFWGVFVIGSTGLVLAFPEFFTRFLPGWMLNVATIVHSDEALLATGFIFTIHFFNTHFRPEKFPMDTVVFTGGMPLEEFKQDRPREYQELVESGRLEEMLMEAPAEKTARRWKMFGFTALAIGLALVLLIIYSVLFVYR